MPHVLHSILVSYGNQVKSEVQKCLRNVAFLLLFMTFLRDQGQLAPRYDPSFLPKLRVCACDCDCAIRFVLLLLTGP